MILTLMRISTQKDDSLGYILARDKANDDPQFMCFTLEDEYRTKKVYGETRIPSGVYAIDFRRVGGFHKRYKKRFPKMHKGMLELQDVPDFKYVLIHIGNDELDTAGCILVGDSSYQNVTKKGNVRGSTNAYRRIYPPIAAALERGEDVLIDIVDWS